MAKEFKLPDLGEGMQEAEILAVLVSVGDKIKEGDPIFEVETDKATVEIPSPFTGVVREILAKPGDTVEVDAVIMTFEGEGEPEKIEKPVPEQPVEAAPPKKEELKPPKPARAPVTGPVPASPATRRLARELGVDLKSVTPTGPGGLMTAEDVRAFAEREQAPRVEEAPEAPAAPPAPEIKIPGAKPVTFEVPPLPDFSKWGDVERVPFRSIRRAMARQMAIAWSEIPHVSNQAEVDITNLEDFRQKHKAEVKEKDGNLSLTVFILKAVATALKTYPQFNAALDVEAGEIVLKNYFHLGVAVNTENGLIVPVIRDVDRKSIVELAIELKSLIQKTRDRKITLEELQGGTFTITNIGPMGGGFFTPLINYPEVAILGLGSARPKPVVKENNEGGYEIQARLMMPMVLCIDHRVLDGADAIQFTTLLLETLQDPDELLLSMI